MALSAFILLMSAGAVSATALSHQFHYIYSCYKSIDVRVDVVLDDVVIAYADFNKGEMVFSVPNIPQSVKEWQKEAYEIAKTSVLNCHIILDKAKRADPGSSMRQEAPDSFIYTRYEGEEDVFNTLYCLANHFYPPTINFTWTKNGVEVTEGVFNLRYRHNADGTFHRISTLTFTPQEGDVYSCRVEHQASQQPLTRNWELKEKKRSGVSPAAVFFIVSLVLCLIGTGTGIFFIFKQPN